MTVAQSTESIVSIVSFVVNLAGQTNRRVWLKKTPVMLACSHVLTL